MSRVSTWWTYEPDHANAINDLDEELTAERASRRDQTTRLSTAYDETRRDLEQVGSRLTSVTGLVGAVLEWTELRFRLLEFEEYRARQEIRKAFRALAHGRPATLAGLEDIPGYWLPPAAQGVLGTLPPHHQAGTPPRPPAATTFEAPPHALESARERDAVRTDLFTLTVALCFDRPALIEATLPRLLSGPADLGVIEAGQVTEGWRTLWKHAAGGSFGSAAAEQLSERVTTLFDASTATEAEIRAWDRAIATFGSDSDTTQTKAEIFAALGAHLTAESGGTETLPPHEQVWHAYVQELVEEPGPDERELVQAMENLPVGADIPRRSAPSWSRPAGTVVALVREDIFDPNAPLPLRRLALRAGGVLLRARLDAALTAPEPVVITVDGPVKIKVTSGGHDAEKLAVVERRIATDYSAVPVSKTLGAAGVGLGCLAVALLVFGQWFTAALAAIGALVLLSKYRADHAAARSDAARRDRALAQVRAAVDKARADSAAAERRAAQRYRTDRQALERLIASLPAP
ncbi:hypothetical protein [Nocardia sp. NPDC024068]|uniref:hypothetical protein n=1 Tax=Nocardia sp. NPDC024068 TaxID=3157197 RepID=UPI00340C8983